MRTNASYAELQPLLPETWRPCAQNKQTLAAYIDKHGAWAFREVMKIGSAPTAMEKKSTPAAITPTKLPCMCLVGH
ncbi:hypothetical protein [Paraburkholderia antibiotica]|uniref:Uncharacterized protein n=1 Tax=Paraburkholderia antibiotica TaxID=2728839 RepID=A0A7X9X6I4_9BURK|nr:hypothetical protein [Paraburkholderia antibiotica]NML31842.1 hypothetical protein [Paraburkholderia antibiotica]